LKGPLAVRGNEREGEGGRKGNGMKEKREENIENILRNKFLATVLCGNIFASRLRFSSVLA